MSIEFKQIKGGRALVRRVRRTYALSIVGVLLALLGVTLSIVALVQ